MAPRGFPNDSTTQLKNTVAVKMIGGKPMIVVYVNNAYEDPGQTLRDSEHYQYLTKQYGSPYPHWTMKPAPGLKFRFDDE